MQTIAPVAVIAIIAEIAKAAKAISDLTTKDPQPAILEQISETLREIRTTLGEIETKLGVIFIYLESIKVLVEDAPFQTVAVDIGGLVAAINNSYDTWMKIPVGSSEAPTIQRYYEDLRTKVLSLASEDAFAHYSAIGLGMVYQRAMLYLPVLRGQFGKQASRNDFRSHREFFDRASDPAYTTVVSTPGLEREGSSVAKQLSFWTANRDRLIKVASVKWPYYCNSRRVVSAVFVDEPQDALAWGYWILDMILGDLDQGFTGGNTKYLLIKYNAPQTTHDIRIRREDVVGPVLTDVCMGELNNIRDEYLVSRDNAKILDASLIDVKAYRAVAARWAA